MTAALLRRRPAGFTNWREEAAQLRADIQRRTASDEAAVAEACAHLKALQSRLRNANALACFRINAEIERAKERLDDALQERTRNAARIEQMHERLRAIGEPGRNQR